MISILMCANRTSNASVRDNLEVVASSQTVTESASGFLPYAQEQRSARREGGVVVHVCLLKT